MGKESQDISDNDEQTFQRAMHDVTPLIKRHLQYHRPSLSRPVIPPSVASPIVTSATPVDKRGIVTDNTFRSHSISPKRFALLQRGRIRPDTVIDLHGDTAAEAERRVYRCLADAVAAHHQCVLIITGKGIRNGGGVLRTQTRQLLASHAAVAAYCPATGQDGGSGAYYVLLRRSGGRP